MTHLISTSRTVVNTFAVPSRARRQEAKIELFTRSKSRTNYTSMAARPSQPKASAPQEGGKVDYEMLDLADLKARREAEIAELNFEEVAIIDAAIAKFQSDDLDKVVTTLKKFVSDAIDQAFQEYDDGVKRQTEATELTQQGAKDKTAQSTGKIKSDHERFAEELEQTTQKSIDREKNRPSARAEELKSRAKLLARNHEIQKAIEMRELAKAQLDDDVAQREFEISQSYKRKKQRLDVKQSAELEKWDQWLEDCLQRSTDKCEESLKTEKRKVVQKIRDALRKAIAKGCRDLQSKAHWRLLSRELTEFAQKKLMEEERDFVFKEGQ